MISIYDLLESYGSYPDDLPELHEINNKGKFNIFIPYFALVAEDWEHQQTIHGPGQYGWPKIKG